MFNRQAMFSSKTSEHYTPLNLYRSLDNVYHFTTDPCTIPENPLGCKIFYTKEQNGLKNTWYGNVFINPPYGRDIVKWVKAGFEYALLGSGTVVMLLPARTDTKWFHDYIYNKINVEITFLKGRLKFGGAKVGAPFPSMLIVFRSLKQDPLSLTLSVPQPQSQDPSLQV